MGTFTFKWEHPAEEVYVTGTFDNWTKSVKLEKEGSLFQKTVELKDASQKIYYKFVVDNNWTTNETAPKEADPEGNVNNFLTPEQIQTGAAAAIISTVTPSSTTAAMAGEQPKEAVPTPSDVPGGFPATPADELDKPVAVNPLPAAAGGVNPIKLEPGEKVPDAAIAGNVNDHVKLDKESYEKSDALPGVQADTTTKNIIPESGLPIGLETVNTVAPTSTTAALAGQVPLEPKVPQVVKESQDKAGADPEASAVAEEVKEKAAVEEELKDKVPVAPSTSEGTAGVGTEKSEDTVPAVATIAAAGGAVAAAAIAAKDTLVENATPLVNQASTTVVEAANNNLPDSVKESLPVSAQEALSSQSKEAKREEVSPEVPSEVKQSIAAAGESPEAAANTSAVKEKEAVEAELLKEVKPAPAADDTKGEAVKPSEAAVETPVAVQAVAPTTEETKPVEAQPVETKPVETKPAEVKETKAEETKPQKSTNGAGSTPAASEPSAAKSTDTTTTDQKKKNRISAFLSKIKHKITD